MSIKQMKKFSFLLVLTGCATVPAPSQHSTPTVPAQANNLPPEITSPQEQILKLQDRIQDLETRLSALNEKINIQNGASPAPSTSAAMPSVESSKTNEKAELKTEVVKSHPSDVNPTRTKKLTFSNEIIDRFREAKILYDSKRFPDSMLEFAEFVKNDPEHSLAPAAQYYVGMSYFQQKEYKLAEEELSRGLIAYPHSNFTPDYLLSLANVSEALGKPERSVYYKQKLLANFPNAPHAKGLNLEPKTSPKTQSKIRLPEEPKSPTAPTEPSVVGGEN